ncbi:RICIN domain-containing protein [Embleya scabrispora]|uniref:RICIN domain-containing protein n=1 Tax=Embleya scabrispora TaxID=159449 RepID=UPI00036D6FB5|nr:RICIN domain-containing protein [Embleya scabrispora]
MFLAFLSLNATAHADPAAPAGKAAQASSELRFFTYNICGEGQAGCGGPPKDNARRIDTVVSQARDWAADEVFLQEVCRSQYDAILSALKPLGFRGMFTTTVGGAVHCGGDYGMAVLVRGPVVETAELDLTAGGENEPIKSPCIKTYTKGRANWACSVHLYWSDGTLEKIEAAKLTAQTDAWRAAGTPVILGGDFNHTPVSVVLDYFYTAPNPDGNGAFVEADETDRNYFTPQCAQASQTHCRSGRPTHLAFNDPTDQKIDYLFLSQGDFTAIQGEVLPRDPAISDHRLYRGTANFTASASGPYTLTNANSGKCLEIRGDSTGDGAAASQWTCNGSATQNWYLSLSPGASTRIVNANSGKCLEIRGDSTQDGAAANQWTCNGSATQNWRADLSVDNSWLLTNVNSAKCLEIWGDSIEDGAAADQWTCNGSATQNWVKNG